MLLSLLLPHAVNCGRFCIWRRQSVGFFCLCMKYLGNRWTDLRQIHAEDVFGTSLRQVWRSRSKIKVTRENNGIFGPFGGLRAVYAMFGKTSLASSFYFLVSTSQSQCTGTNILAPEVWWWAKKRMRWGNWSQSVLCVPFSGLTLMAG